MPLGGTFVLAVWTLLFFLCAGLPGLAQEPYRIGYSTGAKIHVLARDRLKVVYERAGLPVEFLPFPQKRSLLLANEGLLDGEAGRIPGIEKQYANLRRVDVKLIDLVGAAYVLEGWTVGNYRADLLDFARLGAVRGVLWANKIIADRRSEMVNDYTTLFDMLMAGRIDMALASKVSADAVFQSDKERYRGIRELKPFVYNAALYHYVHKKNEHLIPLLEKALRELRAESYWSDPAKNAGDGKGYGTGQQPRQ